MDIQLAVKTRVLEICEQKQIDPERFPVLLDATRDKPLEEIDEFCIDAGIDVADFFNAAIFL